MLDCVGLPYNAAGVGLNITCNHKRYNQYSIWLNGADVIHPVFRGSPWSETAWELHQDSEKAWVRERAHRLSGSRAQDSAAHLDEKLWKIRQQRLHW